MKNSLTVSILISSMIFFTSCHSTKRLEKLKGEWEIEYIKGDPLIGIKQSILFGETTNTGKRAVVYFANGISHYLTSEYEHKDNDSIKFNIIFGKEKVERYNMSGVVYYLKPKFLRKNKILLIGKRKKENTTEETEFVMLLKENLY